MQISIVRENLLNPLRQLSNIVPNKPEYPSLNNILFEAKENTLTLIATDTELELKISTELANTVENPSRFTLPAKKMFDICKNLPDQSIIHIEIIKGEINATVKAGRSKFTPQIIEAEQFPDLANWEPQVSFKIKQKILAGLIEATKFCMAHQHAQYYLNGMHLETTTNTVKATTTDGVTLARCEHQIDSELIPHNVIVPRKAVLELERMLEIWHDEVLVDVGANNIRFTVPNLSFTTKLVSGKYPDMKKLFIIPANFVMQVDAEELKASLTRAIILADEKKRSVKFQLENNNLTISANNQVQETAEENLTVEYQGEPFEINFNAGYVLDVLKTMKAQKAKFEFVNSTYRFLITDSENENAKYIVMPQHK